MIGGSDETASAAGTSATSAISQIDALLSLQEAGDGTSGGANQRARDRGENLLGQLERIRIGLLTGGVPATALQHLGHILQSHREKNMDPALAEVLDEIELRVQVELAKHQRGRG
jgi:hypothetical protein